MVGGIVGGLRMSIYVLAATHEKARQYCREHSLPLSCALSLSSASIRGVHIDKLILLDEPTEHQSKVLAPALIGSEIIYG